jgi:hypothetical protein
MESERDCLCKQIVPELRQRFEPKKIRVLDIDLRWGLPVAFSGTDALLTIFSELTRCKETNTNPFFLAILGQRYGWVPDSKSDVGQKARRVITPELENQVQRYVNVSLFTLFIFFCSLIGSTGSAFWLWK